MTTTLSKLSPANQAAGKQTPVETFKITDIPLAMDSLGWKQGARVMRKWFAGPAYELPKDVKRGSVSPSNLTQTQLLTDLPFDWLFSKSTRVKSHVEELIAELSNVSEFNATVGRLKTPLDQLSRGLLLLMTRLQRIGHLDGKSRTLKSAYEDFSGLSAIQLEDTSQFNLIRIGASTMEKATDDLDDVYGALGSFAIKIAATKIRTMANDLGYPAIEIEEVGLYVRDTYDFLNVDGDQLLGYWNKKGVIRPGPIDYLNEPNFIDKAGDRYFKVTNGSFNSYRKKWSKGGDFLIFSTVKRYPVSIVVHLSDIDFKEFNARVSSI
jgi:hypothetical protein